MITYYEQIVQLSLILLHYLIFSKRWTLMKIKII